MASEDLGQLLPVSCDLLPKRSVPGASALSDPEGWLNRCCQPFFLHYAYIRDSEYARWILHDDKF